MRTLVISEKDIAAKKIAAHLSDGDADQSKQGGVNVYEWKEGKGKAKHEWIVVGLRGHIISLDYPKSLQRWSLQNLPELIWAQPEKKVDKDAKAIGDAVKKLSKKADRVIVATDFDREGELIGVEALQLVKEENAGVDIKRARFSALTKEEVTRAFANLVEVDYKLAASAEARQFVDLAWGATLTRFLSISAGQRGKDFLSVGRVQSPTLALIVDREKEIRAFVPQSYWEVHATVAKGPEGFEVGHEAGRFWEEPKAKTIHRKVSTAKTGRVAKLEKSKRTTQPPTPFSTTDYQRAAAALGYSIKRADGLAESLYTSGYVSYPRTANTVYPPSLDLKEILEKFAAKGSPFEKEAKAILAAGPLHPTAGKKTDPAHPPIHPVEVARAQDLGGPEWRVYELIVRRFFATLSDPAIVERVKVSVEIAEEPFVANGQRLVQPGFMTVYPYSTSKDVILPALAEGDTVNVRGVDLLSKQTAPPSRLTQARLVQQMEELGLGTKATRGDIIQKLYDRDYVRNKTPEPTETGFAMIDALEKYAALIAKPEMTSQLENEMDKIAEADLEMDQVVGDSRKMLDTILKDLDANKDLIGQEIRRALQAKNTIGVCHKSGHPLVMRRSKANKRFVGCAGWPDCDVTYPLPQFGKIVADNTACPICNVPVIRVMNNPRRPPWVTCLTIGCKGAEEREEKSRAERKAAREEKVAPEGDGEDAAPTGDADAEDLGVEEGA